MNSNYYPPAPNDPYSRYQYMALPRPVAGSQEMSNQLAQSIMGQPAQNVTQGAGQLAAGLGMGLRKYMSKQYPAAPGGAQPSFMTSMANLFTGGRNGGLY